LVCLGQRRGDWSGRAPKPLTDAADHRRDVTDECARGSHQLAIAAGQRVPVSGVMPGGR
jgi:hypothetical protein